MTDLEYPQLSDYKIVVKDEVDVPAGRFDLDDPRKRYAASAERKAEAPARRNVIGLIFGSGRGDTIAEAVDSAHASLQQSIADQIADAGQVDAIKSAPTVAEVEL